MSDLTTVQSDSLKPNLLCEFTYTWNLVRKIAKRAEQMSVTRTGKQGCLPACH